MRAKSQAPPRRAVSPAARPEGLDDVARRVADVLQAAAVRGEIDAADVAATLDRLADGKPVRASGAQSRRSDILAAATRVFAKKGYHSATLQDIADDIGLTRPAFYYYFTSKQEVLEAICFGAADETDRVLASLEDVSEAEPVAALRDALTAYGAHVAALDTTAIMMRNFEEMSPAAQQAIAERRRRREAIVLAVLQRAIAMGTLVTPEPKIAVLSLFETLHAMHNWFDPKGRLSRQAAAHLIVDGFLTGLRARENG